jgi:hypothetical protein
MKTKKCLVSLAALSGLLLFGSLSCLASGTPSKAVSAQPTTCRKVTTTMTDSLTAQPFSELVLTGITPLGGVHTGYDDDLKDDDTGCCWIRAGSSASYIKTTWRECKLSTKQITGQEADPKDFHKGQECQSK